jgi:cell division protein FtsB
LAGFEVATYGRFSDGRRGKTGKMLMPRTSNAPDTKKRSIEQLAAEVDELRDRVEDLEDLRDLQDAVKRNAAKPLTQWAKVKKEIEES